MREQEFWRIVKRAGQENHGDGFRRRFRLTESQVTALRLERLLEELPLCEVLRFHHLMRKVYERAYRWELWAAFGIALSGVDEELFRDCVSWLILRGRRRFAKALVNPDALGSAVIDIDEVVGAGAIADVAFSVLEDTDALDDFFDLIVYSEPPAGQRVPEDLPTLRRRYPKLAAKHIPAELAVSSRLVTVVPAQWNVNERNSNERRPGSKQAGAPR
jgi:hypothetical protein